MYKKLNLLLFFKVLLIHNKNILLFIPKWDIAFTAQRNMHVFKNNIGHCIEIQFETESEITPEMYKKALGTWFKKFIEYKLNQLTFNEKTIELTKNTLFVDICPFFA